MSWDLALPQTEVVATQNLAPQVVRTQKIPLNLHYALPLLGPLGVRGTQNLAPQVVRTPKDTTLSPLHLTSTQSIGSEGSKLEVRGGTLGPTEGVGTLKLAATGVDTPKHTPQSPLHLLGPWDLPGASGSLGSLWKPSAALGLQSDSGALLPHPSLPLALWDLPGA